MTNRPKIFVFHLLNDFSGSPKVLMQLIKGWVKNNLEVHLYTSNTQKPGFLSNISSVNYHTGWYVYSTNLWIRLLCFALSQIILFFKMYKHVTKNDIIYVNTVLPFGAALLGKIKGCRVIYHIHESTINPKPLKWFLLSVIKYCATDTIYVSKYVAESHHIKGKKAHLLYNALEDAFLKKATHTNKVFHGSNVLMVCSLKAYKGVYEYINLAKNCPQYTFRIVFNAKEEDITLFFTNAVIPKNVQFIPVQEDLHPHYSWADVVLNLSRPDGWIETFGLTIIEGMAYGLPAIVPVIGGIVEVIEQDKTGFMIDSREALELQKTLIQILSNPLKYQELSANSKERIKQFDESTFIAHSLDIIDNVP